METKDLCRIKHDFNQNLIETSSSFRQLRDMINQVEKDSDIEVVGCNEMDMCIKLDVNLEPALHKYSVEPEKDVTEGKCASSATTYDDIMSFLGMLENDVETDSNTVVNNPATAVVPFYQDPNRHNVQQILNCQKDDLEVARLQIEEKNATIECLKDQLKSERKAACDKMTSQKRSHITKMRELENKYRTIVKRHQKFIEQLIAEKTDLTQKCDSLARGIKETEQKFQRDVKVITERHAVELQRARDNIAASEKIKRERWLEIRTTKIKEMTVKGLEPELHNMIEQHHQEIQELRLAHIKESQDTELRALRKANQQLEQLRIELTDSHEIMLAKEKDTLMARYEEKLEKQEAYFRTMQVTLAKNFERDKENLIAEQRKRDEETNAMLRQTQLRFQKEKETLKEQHNAAKKNFEESLRNEWLAWTDNYKKQQSADYAKAETTIRNNCFKERDKQIEIAIVRLEKESREMRTKLQQSFDNKLELMKEEHDAKLQSAIKSENVYKNKLLLLEEKFESTEVQLEQTENKLKEYMSKLSNMNQTVIFLTSESNNAKEIARQEFETQKRELENTIASLYEEISQNNEKRERFLAQLHSRVKLIIAKKVRIIKDLQKKLDDANSTCEHLEKLLDHQRKEYILKNL